MIKFDKSTNVLIVGLGLIGGSYAMALSKRGCKVNAITLNQADIDYAVEKGIIDRGTTDIDAEMIREADIVVFALYPTVFVEWIKKNQVLFKPNTIITDVTGVKGSVVDAVQSILRDDVEFIAAHPMAGREQSGVEFSDDRVFRGANYIVTPTEKNTPEAIEICKELGRALGFERISELSPDRHDDMIAFLSQLTHCIAVSLMTSNGEENMEKYTGDSFRDLTRIAKINEVMWSELFLMNKEALLKQMDCFEAEFNKLRQYIVEDKREEMQDMMRRSTERRKKFDKK